MKIAIIGLGKMGRPIAGAIGKIKGFNVIECKRGDNVNKKIEKVDAFIIAVKPQNFKELASSISIDLSKKLTISIMAGVSVENIQKSLKMKRVSRAMPNLGVQVGFGVTGLYFSSECTNEDESIVSAIFSSMGKVVNLDDELMFDSLSVISGSGPAYFFLMAEILKEKAIEYGFTAQQADLMAAETLIGSAKLLESGDNDFKQWQQAVASKGGITEQALKCLKENNFFQILKSAIDEGRKKAKEICKS